MIAATGIDDIRRGEYQLVLGELHMANNTIRGSNFVSQHPSPEDLFLAMAADIPESRLIPATPIHYPGLTNRTKVVLKSSSDYTLEFESSRHETGPALQIGSLVIEPTGDALSIGTPDGNLRFDLMDLFGSLLASLVADSFRLLGGREYTPRICIDKLTVCRETWRIALEDLEFAKEKSEAARFLGARRLARRHRTPQFVFVKVPVETKPTYLDFDSPIYVELFNKSIRRTFQANHARASITISEMLPGPRETWLPDAAGDLYTNELRIVGVDLASMSDNSQIVL